MMNFMSGKLSYTVAGLNVLWAIYGYFMGYIDGEVAIAHVLAGAGIFGIRRAI